MSIESTIILNSVGDQSTDFTAFTFTSKFKGAGYHRLHSGVHTMQFDLDQFEGQIKVQATLLLYPGETDWVDLEYQSGSQIEASDSTPLTSSFFRTILGNWVWIRVGYILEQGSITQVRYTF